MVEESKSFWSGFGREAVRTTKYALIAGVIFIALVITLNGVLALSLNTSKMIVWYDMNESSGALYDATGRGHYSNNTEGTPVYSGTLTAGIYFNGVSAIWINHSSDLNFGSGDFTICAIANLTNQNADYMAPFGHDDYHGVGGYSGYYLQRDPVASANKMTYTYRNATTSSVTATGTTSHNNEVGFTTYCAVREGGKIQVFVNGTAEGTNTSAAIFVQNQANLKIGRGDDLWGTTGNNWHGSINRAFIYNGSLSGADQTSIHNSGVPLSWYDLTYVAPNVTSYITFISQSPSDITTLNAIGGVNVTYNFTDPNLNVTSPYLNWTVKNSSGSLVPSYVNGSLVSTYESELYTNYSSSQYRFFFDDNIYPGTFNIEADIVENLVHYNYTLTNTNNLCKIELLNTSIKTYEIVEVDIRVSSSNVFSNIYYCNSSYTSGLITTNPNCVIIQSSNYTQCGHTHNVSCHNAFPMQVIANKFNNVTFTSDKSYFIVQGPAVAGSVYLGYVNQTPRPTATACSGNLGNTYTNQVWTADAHLHFYEANDYWEYTPYYKNTSGSVFNGTLVRDAFNITNLPPSSVVVTLDQYTINYGSNLLITRTNSTPFTGTIANYSYQLFNASFSFYSNINISTNATSQTWNVSNAPSGFYYVSVRATDTNGLTSRSFSEPLLIRNKLISPCNISVTTNSTGANVLFNWTTDIAINTTQVYTYSNSTDYTLVANTTGYSPLTLVNGTYNIFINNTNNDSTRYVFDTNCYLDVCRSNWTSSLTVCTTGIQTKTYTDISGCTVKYDVPADNGTGIACTVSSSTFNVFFLIILFGLILLALGLYFHNYILLIVGGLTLFLSGTYMLMEPINNLTSGANLFVGIVIWGLGAYIFGTATYEMIDEGKTKSEED